MENRKSRFINLGVLALPIFCCLVGALMVMGLSTGDSPTPPVGPDELTQLGRRVAVDKAALAQTRELGMVISNRICLVEYCAANEELKRLATNLLADKATFTNRVTEDQILQSRMEELHREMDSTAAETASTKARVADLQKRVAAAATNDVIGLVPNYSGSLVLLECDDQGAVAHPGGHRYSINATETDLQPLYDAISQAGFLALVARPGGFEKSYDHFHHLVFDHIEKMNQGRTDPIGRCAFPLSENEPLTAFVNP